jgi:hypothetical protein
MNHVPSHFFHDPWLPLQYSTVQYELKDSRHDSGNPEISNTSVLLRIAVDNRCGRYMTYRTQQRSLLCKYYLADVEGFINMTVVIPDRGGQTNDYFVLKARENSKDIFGQ